MDTKKDATMLYCLADQDTPQPLSVESEYTTTELLLRQEYALKLRKRNISPRSVQFANVYLLPIEIALSLYANRSDRNTTFDEEALHSASKKTHRSQSFPAESFTRQSITDHDRRKPVHTSLKFAFGSIEERLVQARTAVLKYDQLMKIEFNLVLVPTEAMKELMQNTKQLLLLEFHARYGDYCARSLNIFKNKLTDLKDIALFKSYWSDIADGLKEESDAHKEAKKSGAVSQRSSPTGEYHDAIYRVASAMGITSERIVWCIRTYCERNDLFHCKIRLYASTPHNRDIFRTMIAEDIVDLPNFKQFVDSDADFEHLRAVVEGIRDHYFRIDHERPLEMGLWRYRDPVPNLIHVGKTSTRQLTTVERHEALKQLDEDLARLQADTARKGLRAERYFVHKFALLKCALTEAAKGENRITSFEETFGQNQELYDRVKKVFRDYQASIHKSRFEFERLLKPLYNKFAVKVYRDWLLEFGHIWTWPEALRELEWENASENWLLECRDLSTWQE